MPEIGFCILVNGVPRTYRDRQDTAHDAAAVIKKRWPGDLVTIKKPDGTTVTMMVDGRTG